MCLRMVSAINNKRFQGKNLHGLSHSREAQLPKSLYKILNLQDFVQDFKILVKISDFSNYILAYSITMNLDEQIPL